MTRYFLIFCLCTLHGQFHAVGQSKNPVSLTMEKLEALQTDTARVDFLLKIVHEQILRDPMLSLEYSAKAIVFARQSGSKLHLLDALGATSKSYFYAGYPGEAATYVEEFAEIAQSYGNDIHKARACNDLAALKSSVQNDRYDPEATRLFQKALDLFQKASAADSRLATDSAFQTNIIGIYANLSFQFKLKEDFNLAESYLLKALNLHKKTSLKTQLGIRTLANYMDLMRLQRREKDMFSLYARGMALLEELGYGAMSPLFDYPVAQWYESQQNISKAILFYEKVYASGKATKNHSYIKFSAQKLSKLYEQNQNSEIALKYDRIAEESAQKEKNTAVAIKLKEAELKAQFRAWEEEIVQKNKSYRKWIVRISFLALSLVLIGILKVLHLRSQNRITTLKNLEMELNAQNLVLEKELLKVELEAKNKLLTAEILRKIQKNDLIKETATQLLEQSRKVKPEVRNILRSSAENLKETLDENSWLEFDIRFKEVDQRCYDILSNSYPTLSLGEKRLCALLRLGMSSKEILAITGQSIRAVELMRSRIRKKLNINNTEISLTQFLAQL